MLEKLINILKLKEHERATEAYECEQKAKILRAEESTYRDAAEMANNLFKKTITKNDNS